MKNQLLKLSFVLFAVVLLLAPRPAQAYGYATQSKIVERAVNAMEALERPIPLSVAPPPGVSDAEFQAYLQNVVRLTPFELRKLRTGLPTTFQEAGFTPLPGISVGSEAFPFRYDEIRQPDPNDPESPGILIGYDVPNCSFYPDDNLADLNQFQIKDFRYVPQRTSEQCGVKPLDPMDPDARSPLGTVLGWHAGSVDDHYNDSVLWNRPTSVGFLAALKEFAIEASNATIGAIVVAVVCLVKLFSGDFCDFGEELELAKQYNPVVQLDGYLPGWGDFRSELFTGLWHFIHVEERPGDNNNIPGMYYLEAGKDYPGAFDFAVMASADLTGLSLNAAASNGDDHYGDYDDLNRVGPAPWQVYTIGHLEFSPLDNLARYGWERYVRSPTSASHLAWPLHAIGDASEPHHVTGTSSWGHVPMETAIEDDLWQFFPETEAARDEQLARILAGSYGWHQQLQSVPDVEVFIEALAYETRNRVAAEGDWALQDTMTVLHLSGGGEAAKALYLAGHWSKMQALLEMSASAAVAFLVTTAERVQDPGPGDYQCPAGTQYRIVDGCVAGPASQCGQAQVVCQAVGDCPSPTYQVCSNGCCEWRVM